MNCLSFNDLEVEDTVREQAQLLQCLRLLLYIFALGVVAEDFEPVLRFRYVPHPFVHFRHLILAIQPQQADLACLGPDFEAAQLLLGHLWCFENYNAFRVLLEVLVLLLLFDSGDLLFPVKLVLDGRPYLDHLPVFGYGLWQLVQKLLLRHGLQEFVLCCFQVIDLHSFLCVIGKVDFVKDLHVSSIGILGFQDIGKVPVQYISQNLNRFLAFVREELITLNRNALFIKAD